MKPRGTSMFEAGMPVPAFEEVLFASFPDHLHHTLQEFFNFGSLERVPNCTKYTYPPPHSIRFERRSPFTELSGETLNLRRVTTSNSEFFLLHPARFDRVKHELSAGLCVMPWIYMTDGQPRVMDGRHRITALLKAGVTHAPCLIPTVHRREVLAAFG